MNLHQHPGHASFDHMPKPEEFSASADLFRLMGDSTRVKLFWILCHSEECVVNLAAMMDMSSPALSHHLKLLKACRLITSRREGKEVYYRAAHSLQADSLHHMIEKMAEISCPEDKQGRNRTANRRNSSYQKPGAGKRSPRKEKSDHEEDEETGGIASGVCDDGDGGGGDGGDAGAGRHGCGPAGRPDGERDGGRL